MTKGHVALGGGGLGLFGSGCLHTWPQNLEQVQERFLDTSLINKKLFMDDSAYRYFFFKFFSKKLIFKVFYWIYLRIN